MIGRVAHRVARDWGHRRVTTMPLPEDRYVEVQGHRIRYWDAGAGPPLVLLHGLGNSVLIWRHTVDPLGRRYRVVALDLPGHGLSDMPRQRFDLPAAANFLAAFLDAVGVSSAHLAGNSMGGLIALELALRQPDRVSSLSLVDSAGLGREIAAFLRLGSIPGVGEYFERPTYGRLYRLHRFLVFDPARIEEEAVAKMVEYRNRPGARQALLEYLRAGVNVLGQRRSILRLSALPSLRAPLMVVWGQEDRLVPAAHAEAVARIAPHARVHVFERCGHWPEIERPTEFNDALAAFLVGAEGPPSPQGSPPLNLPAPAAPHSSGNPSGGGAAEGALALPAEATLESPEPRQAHWIKEKRLRLTVLAAVAAVIATVLVFRHHLADVDAFLDTLGYPAVFLLALAGAVSMVVPLPSTAGTFLAGGFLNPGYVGVIAGVGEAIGEMSGYAVGYSGRGIVERNRLYVRIEAWVERHGGLAILFFAIIPNPVFDFLGIAAGALRYPLPKFLLYAWLGKTLKNLGLAYAGSVGAQWVLDLFGISSPG